MHDIIIRVTSPDSDTVLSIVICTYNRANKVHDLLSEIFEKFREMLILSSSPQNLKSHCELILVDNNSTDNTQDMIFRMLSEKRNQGIDFRYIIELEQGSSAARNRGIQEANGNLMIFLDDDISIQPKLLDIVYKLALERPRRLCLGARIIPEWQVPKPSWLNLKPPYEIIESCFPSHDYGDEPKSYPFKLGETKEMFISGDNDFNDQKLKVLEDIQSVFQIVSTKLKAISLRQVSNPISACFLCTRDIFEQYGVFRRDLGIVASERGACEDTEFFWRLISQGIEIKYYPQITVYHPINKERMTQTFVLNWYKLIGKTLEYMKLKKLTHLNPNAKLDSELSLRLKMLIYRFLFLFSYTDPVKNFWYKAQISKLKGALSFVLNYHRNLDG